MRGDTVGIETPINTTVGAVRDLRNKATSDAGAALVEAGPAIQVPAKRHHRFLRGPRSEIKGNSATKTALCFGKRPVVS